MLLIKKNRASNGRTPVVLFTDGSANNVRKVGGWAFVGSFEGRVVAKWGFGEGTSNVMELTAMIEAMKFVLPTEHPLHVFPDSQYVLTCIQLCKKWKSDGWRGSLGDPIKNQELIRELSKVVDLQHHNRRLQFQWVKAHNGNPLNEIADKLAGMACRDRVNGYKSVMADYGQMGWKDLLALLT